MTEARPVDLLSAYAARHPEKLALVEDLPGHAPRTWSYAALERDANRLANALLGLGIRPGDKVVWCGLNSSGVVCMVHAARKLGVTAVPLNYRLTAEEAAYVVDDSDAVAVYADAEFAALFAEVRGCVPKLREVVIFGGAALAGQRALEPLLENASAEPPQIEPAEASGETMIYTSGTTGRPKGALRRTAGDPEQVRAMLTFVGYVPDDVYLTTGPLYHSGPGGFMNLAYSLGNTVVVQRKFDPEDWLRLVQHYRVTTTFSAPTPIRMLCHLSPEVKAKYDCGSMKRMIANAAPWSLALKEQYLADFPEDSLFEIYGSTELGVNTILRPEDQRRKPGSCGKPSPGVSIALFDDGGEEITEPNVPGELYVKSKSMFSAYHKAQEKFESGRRGDWLSVGDVAYRDAEGYYYICDRKSDMIISGGMNVYPAEVEAALEGHPAVADVAVIGIPSEEWGESVHAVVATHLGETLSEGDLIAFARGHLAGYKLPRSVSFTDEIPRTASGKILKRMLRAPFWKGHGSQLL